MNVWHVAAADDGGHGGAARDLPPADIPVAQPTRLTVVAATVIAMAVVLGAISIAGARANRTAFGRPLGEDFAVFYDAGRVLNSGRSSRLYDVTYEDNLYHGLFPTLPTTATLPYVYPPVVAELVRPLARLPYKAAFALWLVFGLVLYLVGLRLITTAVGLQGGDRLTIELLALSFEPFIFETWLGGQTGSLAFAALGAAFFFDRRDRPLAMGLALGVCAYKPTLLLYAVPLLLLSRSWRGLAGVALSSSAIVGASLLTVGWGTTSQYGRALLSHAGDARGAGTISLRLWKFVDVNSFLRMSFGNSIVITLVVAVAIVACLLAIWSSARQSPASAEARAIVWAAAVTATTVVTFYTGVYDTVLLAAAGVILFAVCPPNQSRKVLPWLLAAVYAAPVASQLSAKSLHLQLFTVVIVALFAYELRLLKGPWTLHARAAPVGAGR